MIITGETYGDWDKFAQTLQALKENTEAYHNVIKQMGEEIATRIWDLIESQSIDLEPLKEDYRRKKIAQGYGNDILIRTGDYLNSIDVTDIRVSGYDIEVEIGILDGTTSTGISMKELAKYLEFGTSKMVGRMPIHKSWEAMSGEVKSEVRSQLLAIIKEDLP